MLHRTVVASRCLFVVHGCCVVIWSCFFIGAGVFITKARQASPMTHQGKARRGGGHGRGPARFLLCPSRISCLSLFFSLQKQNCRPSRAGVRAFVRHVSTYYSDENQVFEGIAGELNSRLAAAAAASMRGGGEGGKVVEEATVPIEGMQPGTSGLRKKVGCRGRACCAVHLCFFGRIPLLSRVSEGGGYVNVTRSLQHVFISE